LSRADLRISLVSPSEFHSRTRSQKAPVARLDETRLERPAAQDSEESLSPIAELAGRVFGRERCRGGDGRPGISTGPEPRGTISFGNLCLRREIHAVFEDDTAPSDYWTARPDRRAQKTRKRAHGRLPRTGRRSRRRATLEDAQAVPALKRLRSGSTSQEDASRSTMERSSHKPGTATWGVVRWVGRLGVALQRMKVGPSLILSFPTIFPPNPLRNRHPKAHHGRHRTSITHGREADRSREEDRKWRLEQN